MKSNVQKDSIRIDTGAKRVYVNDNDEYIILNFADQRFPTRFDDMVEDFKEKQKEFQKRAQEIDDNKELTEDKRKEYGHRLNLEVCTYFRDQIDKLFGPETCRKVFGDIIPGIDLFGEFLEKISPFFEKYAKERGAKLAQKYNPLRKGNV